MPSLHDLVKKPDPEFLSESASEAAPGVLGKWRPCLWDGNSEEVDESTSEFDSSAEDF